MTDWALPRTPPSYETTPRFISRAADCRFCPAPCLGSFRVGRDRKAPAAPDRPACRVFDLRADGRWSQRSGYQLRGRIPTDETAHFAGLIDSVMRLKSTHEIPEAG